MPLSLDIHTAVQTALVISIVALIFSIWQGIASIRNARNLPFFRMRRQRMVRGWRLLFTAIVLALVAFLLNTQAEPMIYTFFPPTPTVTMTPTVTTTPTITLTPTTTLTPTITPTPSVSDTPTVTPTPYIPLSVSQTFTSTVTPGPGAVFSELTFTDGLDELYRPLKPGTSFKNPIGHMYAVFSYDNLINGVQWTALWYRGSELVYFETKPWDGGTGGLGYTDWPPDKAYWLPGEYQVQIFIGSEIKVSGTFTVEGEPPTPRPTSTGTPTITPTQTPTGTATPRPTITPIPTRTPRPSATPSQIPTVTPTHTPYMPPTQTPRPTPWPTLTRTPVTPTITPQPTLTRTASITPQPTQTRNPSP
jgi:hypothetical protein